MNGILIVNKPKGITSRDVVNKISKIYKIKKIGHTGTLDPLATGVLVLCIGNATKLVELLTSDDKEYIATVKIGVLTDTLDIDGKVIQEREDTLDENKLVNVLNSFIGEYEQEVPIYSAVKIKGKKLYEYARENISVKLPKRCVTIKKIELLECNDDYYKFKVNVSKGTYIRSLIKDINNKLGIIGVMSDLIRTKQGFFSLQDTFSILDVEKGKEKIFSIREVLYNYDFIEINDKLYNKIKNGQLINNIYKNDIVAFTYKNDVVALYKTYDKDNSKMKPYKMFLN